MKMHENMSNSELTSLLKAVAAAYKIKDEEINRFRIIAYERAADAVEHMSSEAKDLWDDGKLSDVAGIGKNIASHLGDIFQKGESEHFKGIMQNIPGAVFELIKISGVGPKNGVRLVEELNITNKDPIGQLKKHAEAGKIAQLEGFGVDSQNSILQSIKEVTGREIRMLLPYAMQNAELILEWMRRCNSVERVEALGSLRRKSATVGDIDIAVAGDELENIIEHFTKYPNLKRVIEKGARTVSIIIPPELQIDLMVTEKESFGSLLQHFTGSKHHNITLRELAQKKGLSLSEYGIKIVSETKDLKPNNKNYNKEKNIYMFEDEESFYGFLGMEWIPPELREDRGEIEVAQQTFWGEQNGLPQLVELVDIKGDLQIHSDFDIETSHDLGESSMKDVLVKAKDLGYEYVAFTEHNPSQKGHNEKQIYEILAQKTEAVAKVNEWGEKKQMPFAINSLEIDILPDGKLPLDDASLKLLDFALVSIHSSFRQGKDEATKRVLDAFSRDKVKVFAHPTGRKINEREGVELDWDKIFDHCINFDKWLEINGDPMRLDLPDHLVREAVKTGVKMTLGTDSHHKDHMDNIAFAVSVARRGWAEDKDIINTLSLKEFKVRAGIK
jgi:DNA polymerase (family X)